MNNESRESIRFTLNGRRYELVRGDVEDRLAQLAPDVIRKHAVRVNDTWFPVIQAFEVGTGISRPEFTSYTARRHLAALGFVVSGGVEPRTPQPQPQRHPAVTSSTLPPDGEKRSDPAGAWHTEAQVQASLVTALAGEGWRILSVANTATRERGIDVVASREGQTVGIEVKGYPSREYADPARAGEVKRSRPSTQAGHWYSQAVLAAMRLRGKEPEWRSVIALPDFPRYRDLLAETAGSLRAANIEVWWVDQVGHLHAEATVWTTEP